jgi:hypothetical protein
MASHDLTITRRQMLSHMGVAAATVAMGSCATFKPGASAARRPNIIFILTDDQRWDAMSCMGHPIVRTPHMDRLRREGVLFENAFVTTSLSAPSRASFLTGVYAHNGTG